MFPRIVLALSSLVYLAIGLMFLAAPESLLPRVNITAPSGTALTDIRAVYGGLDLGIGLFLAVCLVRGNVNVGLTACLLTLSGLACGRVLGIALNPEQDAITYYLLAAEVLGAGTALAAITLFGGQTEHKQ